MSTTTISIFVKDWKRLNNRKEVGESLAVIVKRVLDDLEKKEFEKT